MNTPNSIGFIIVGLLMEALHFLPNMTDVREMWLLVMGGLLMAIGLFHMGQAAWFKVAPSFRGLALAISRKRAEAGSRGIPAAGHRAHI